MPPAEPDRDCPLCPRLVGYRSENAALEPEWFNAPVPSFGPSDARLLIVGLAPGRTGANRTGRPFTGDWAGDLLYATLAKHGFSQGAYDRRPDDGLTLLDCMITNAVRCAPPQNKPTGAEAKSCRAFLIGRIADLPRLTAILALGRIAHDAVVSISDQRRADAPFGHQARNDITVAGRRFALFDSYHCSRYNTNTGRLTEAMFDAVFQDVKSYLEASAALA